MTAALLRSATPPPDDWPELLSLDSPNLPRLDPGHLPGWAGDFARALSTDAETPPELAAGMILATCATAVARRLQVMVKPGYFEHCNLWVVVTLPPGNRKSGVQSAASAPLVAWEHDQAEIMEPEIKHVTSERKTMEARAKEMRSKAAKEKDANKAKELAREAADIEAELPDFAQCAESAETGQLCGYCEFCVQGFSKGQRQVAGGSGRRLPGTRYHSHRCAGGSDHRRTSGNGAMSRIALERWTPLPSHGCNADGGSTDNRLCLSPAGFQYGEPHRDASPSHREPTPNAPAKGISLQVSAGTDLT
jgi:hypothetical protein